MAAHIISYPFEKRNAAYDTSALSRENQGIKYNLDFYFVVFVFFEILDFFVNWGTRCNFH